MKKVLSTLLAIVMVFSLLPISAFAAETGGKITFTTDFTNDLGVGDTFTVTATLSENPGIASFANQLKWNDAVIEFLGFKEEYDEDEEADVIVSEIFTASGWSFATNLNGTFTAGRENNRAKNGTLYVGEFKIIAEEGELGLGLTTTEFGQKFTFANADGTDIMPALDFSAITGLTVGGKAVGAEIPEALVELGVSAITANNGGTVISIEYADELEYDSYGMGTGGTFTDHYQVTVTPDVTEIYVTFPGASFVNQSGPNGEDWVGAAFAVANNDTLEGGMAGLTYEMNDADTTVTIPTIFASVGMNDWSVVEKGALKCEDEDYYAVGPKYEGEDAAVVLFSIAYEGESGEEEDIYSITIDQNIEGGNVWAENEDGDEITKAKEGAEVWLGYEANSGYRMKTIGYFYEGQFNHAENGAIVMPAGEITLSATFEKLHTHVYDKEVPADKYLKDAATCKSGAVYYKSCECGEFVTTAETFVSGESVPHHYVDGKCEWCQLAEVIGYRFATSADVSAENGGTATVKVMITGHSDPNVDKYNAYDITLTYDSDKLEYQDFGGAVKSDNGRIEVDAENGTIRIVGCGADKPFGTEIAALTFKIKAEGNANVTINKVQVSDKEESLKDDAPEATPKHDDKDTTNKDDETPDVSVILVPYTVSGPNFVSGNKDKVLHGESYTFSYTDTTNYTYSDLIVKVGGTEVTPTEENGVYTIENVTGAIEITATQTPNSYDVTKPNNVNGPVEATYGTNYVFTVTPSKEDMAIDTVTVKYADGSEVPYTINDNGEYVIAGTSITGAFTITVTEKAKMTTITFTGIEETEIDGGKLTMTAEIAKDFTFKLIKDEDFDYTIKVGDSELTESTETAGQYTIPAELVVKDGVQVDITKEDNTKPVIDVAEYIKLDGKAMFLVTAKWRDKVLAYGEEGTMFWSDKYTVTGETEAGAYCWLVLSTDEMNNVELVKAAAEAAIVEAAEGVTATAISYDYDVNGTTIVDINDAQLAYDMYNASYMEFSENLTMVKFLEADMETDAKLDTKDVAAIISYIVSQHTTENT